MSYNSNIHHRRSIRLKGYDYSKAGLYFITICCQDRQCRFGKIDVGASLADAQMILNEYGRIAYDEWCKLPERFRNFELDVFQIMPNHMHGIIVLNNVDDVNVGAPLAGAQLGTQSSAQNKNGQPDNVDVGAPLAGAQLGTQSGTQNENGKPDNVDVGAPLAGAQLGTQSGTQNENSQPNNVDVGAPLAGAQLGTQSGTQSGTQNGQPDVTQPHENGQPHGAGQPQGIAPTRETIKIKTNASVGDIVGAYKSLVANACLEIHKTNYIGAGLAPAHLGKLWQRNYYEHIIRNEQSYQTISDYIINNPQKWKDDKFYSA